MCRLVLCNFSDRSRLELDLAKSIDVEGTNGEVQLDIASLPVDSVNNLITNATQDSLYKLCAAVAYVCDRLEVDCDELLINYLYTERR